MLQWAARDEKVFVLESRFFVKRAYHKYAWGYPKKIFHPEKISVSEIGVITLNFGPWSTKLGGTVGAIKK